MPGIVRQGDSHNGHASPTPSPFHKTTYSGGSPNVNVNGKAVQRVGDTTSCGDPAVGASPTVFANGIAVHRLGDATGGHGSWVPNSAASASSNVFADEIGAVNAPTLEETIPITPQQFFLPKFKETAVSYASNIQQVGLSQVPPDHPYNPEQVDAFDEVPNPTICGEGQFVNPYDLAASYLGGSTWKERHMLGGTNPMIKGLWDEIGYNGAAYADNTAWCAVFVGAILKRANCTYKKTASSQAYAGHGISIATGNDLTNVKKGDIIVFYRKGPSSGLGHVGFYAGNHTATTVDVLGGNQGDDLNVRTFQRVNASKGWGLRSVRRAVLCSDGTTPAPDSGTVALASSGSGGSVT